ncbi:MAG: 1-(5-phosphoribosyl)-5-[(5-phosphoribosylamino)methylideneamino]imidazole-4-carboxamide isomerase [Clostridiales Family XIII bacterium]|jgi:phosphoribosylformimino-5-aminoimidazole carboxamide ribotide isomerase|nr:1-(5-phosphoribosyl)-5-[(5-phosphoribosylamino)methylideneamino]imidazole-4-carboxamide isomerase [Clostridiales Family XIII bacterium]
MLIFPAIDLIDGVCVRLTRGDYGTAEQVADDPQETAREFAACGASWIHMVDLDGAKVAVPRNAEVILRVARQRLLQVEVGGGIRTMENIAMYLENGVSRVILGSVALSNPDLVCAAVQRYGSAIAVGIDARNGFVQTGGWLSGSEVRFTALAKEMEKVGVRTIIYTDIGRDGTLTGPNIEDLIEMSDATSLDIIASGGIRDIHDIRKCKSLGLYGAICGKSLYKGTLDLREAVRVAEREE